MHHFDFFKHRGHRHDRHHHNRDRKHGGKYCEKFGKRGHHFKHMLRSMGSSDWSNMNPQDPDIQEKMRLFVMEFFNTIFMERQAGNRMENKKGNEAGEGTSKGGDNLQPAANNSRCKWRGRGRHYAWKGCQYDQTAGRNISEDKSESATETQGKESEEDTEETPYCKHAHHHHRGYERRHHNYGHGKCQGRFSGDESSTEDEKWLRRGRQHHHHHHRERHGYNHHGRMGWKKREWDWFHVEATTTVNENADSGSQEPNQEVGGNGMQVDPAPAPEIEHMENREEGQNEAGEGVQEVSESLRKSSLE